MIIKQVNINNLAQQGHQAELKKIEQTIEAQAKTVQNIGKKVEQLGHDYQKLNKELSKELSFREGLKFVLAAEGGLSDDEGDRGGLTNLGITHSEYAEYRARKGFSPRSVTQISLLEATDIYKHSYWVDCADTPRRIAISCFDWQVNSGRGVSTLQQTLGGVAVDGIIGTETLNELNYWLLKPKNEDKLLHNYFDRRENYYRRWGVGSQRKFLSGWLRRAESLKKYLHVN